MTSHHQFDLVLFDREGQRHEVSASKRTLRQATTLAQRFIDDANNRGVAEVVIIFETEVRDSDHGPSSAGAHSFVIVANDRASKAHRKSAQQYAESVTAAR